MMIFEFLALHALPSCDSGVVSYGIGKKTAITVVQKVYTLDQLGQLTADIANVTNKQQLSWQHVAESTHPVLL